MRAFLPRSSEERPTEDAIREARVDVARRNSRWSELEEVDLVPRGPRNRWLVSATTDEIFERTRGVVFQTGSTTVIADVAPLSFYLDRDRVLVFLEKVTNPATYTEHLERQAAKERRRAAPRPRTRRSAA